VKKSMKRYIALLAGALALLLLMTACGMGGKSKITTSTPIYGEEGYTPELLMKEMLEEASGEFLLAEGELDYKKVVWSYGSENGKDYLEGKMQLYNPMLEVTVDIILRFADLENGTCWPYYMKMWDQEEWLDLPEELADDSQQEDEQTPATDSSPEPTVPAETTPAATDAPSPEPSLAPIPESPLSEAEILARYEPVFRSECPRGSGVLLADLTWDGIPEMLVTYAKGSGAADKQQTLDVYSIQGEQVNMIRRTNARSASGDWAEWYLYTDDSGRNYLIAGANGESAVYLSHLDAGGGLLRDTEESLQILQQGTVLVREGQHYANNEFFAQSAAPLSLSSEGQRRVNLFLSNFSEQEFRNFERDVSPDARMIEFAFLQIKINSHSSITYQDGSMMLSADTLEKTTQRFFGRTPARGSTDWLIYSNGNYICPAADGAFVDYVTVVDNMYDLGDGTYEVSFTVYENYTNQDQYGLTPEQASDRSDLVQYASGIAVLEDSVYNGNPSYHLISYQVD